MWTVMIKIIVKSDMRIMLDDVNIREVISYINKYVYLNKEDLINTGKRDIANWSTRGLGNMPKGEAAVYNNSITAIISGVSKIFEIETLKMCNNFKDYLNMYLLPITILGESNKIETDKYNRLLNFLRKERDCEQISMTGVSRNKYENREYTHKNRTTDNIQSYLIGEALFNLYYRDTVLSDKLKDNTNKLVKEFKNFDIDKIYKEVIRILLTKEYNKLFDNEEVTVIFK